jgi:hypothetical protein
MTGGCFKRLEEKKDVEEYGNRLDRKREKKRNLQ